MFETTSPLKIKKVILAENLRDKIDYDYGKNQLDFVLPQKNNILGESIQKPGGLVDRKQIVYRGAVDVLPDVPDNMNMEIRTPDFTKKTNYIFEKTLQNERITEYANKETLKRYLKSRFSYYWVSLPHKIITTRTDPDSEYSKDTQSELITNYVKKLESSYKKKIPQKKNIDFYVDRLSKL